MVIIRILNLTIGDPYHTTGVFLIKNGRKKFNLPVNYVVRFTDHFSDHRASYLNLHGSHAD